MRLIQSVDIPQADRLESVLLAVIAVGNGARTDVEIANQIPGISGDERQGRYYRKSAQLMRFIDNHRNNASIIPKGKELLQNPVLSNPLLIASVLNLEVYQKLLPYLEIHPEGITRKQIQQYLQSIADPRMGISMITRRISTILAWPKALGFLTQSKNKLYQIQNNLSSEVPVFEIQSVDQPLLPVCGDLLEYQEIEKRTTNARDDVAYYKDQVKIERAANSHIALVNLVSQRIREIGGIPKSNQLIDLAVRLDQDYIFEMKSTTEENIRAQVRKGMSQLYEYRYLQNRPEAKLILVVEKPLGSTHEWMKNYLESDRNINLVWDGNNQLYGSEQTRNQLAFLSLNQ